MSIDLRQAAAEHLRLRRSLGYRLADHDWLIASFLDYVESRGRVRIAVEDALTFAQATSASRAWRARRLAIVRELAVYVHSCDPAAAELIPPDLIHASRICRRVPYLYTPEQIAALMTQAGTLSPPVLGATMSTLIGLMAVTGMRTCEVRRLDVENFDVARQVLTVTGKGGKQRLIPVDASTVAYLVDYLRLRAGAAPTPQAGPLLVGCRGGRLNKCTAEAAFRKAAKAIGIAAGPGGATARLYDLRHTFAVNSLIDAHRQGVDVDARVALLSIYLGHSEPANTYWYLTASPELMTLVRARMSAGVEGQR